MASGAIELNLATTHVFSEQYSSIKVMTKVRVQFPLFMNTYNCCKTTIHIINTKVCSGEYDNTHFTKNQNRDTQFTLIRCKYGDLDGSLHV